jgi:acylphosphatase
MPGQTERIHIQIQGRVQGVFFRASSREKAHALGLTGWVRNQPDRQVEIVAEGPRELLEALLAWCRTGPPLARVKSVKTGWSDSTGEYSSFEVR